MRNNVIYFRSDINLEKEYQVAKTHFDVKNQRSDVVPNSIVIPRYSALPYYKELEYDITKQGSTLINTYEQFRWIANFEYYDELKDFTFPTYFDQQTIPDIPLIVKGKTNSRKHQWNSNFFARNKEEAIYVACELRQDSLIGQQDIIFREYMPLRTFEYLINGLPVTNEFRFFFYKGRELCHGYYWSNAENTDRICDEKGIELAHEVANIAAKYNNFFVIDIGEKENGEWIMVELNAGEMSGLSICNPEELYRNLKDFASEK